ncbi:MAG: hypothetical protein ACD_38C00105G0002 [uncultured bacterium]|nr:MAG: hypothetical protein ACD_38C00105G0002 [uncultured bacterium]
MDVWRSIEKIVDKIFAPKNKSKGISRGVRFITNRLSSIDFKSHAPTIRTVKA